MYSFTILQLYHSRRQFSKRSAIFRVFVYNLPNYSRWWSNFLVSDASFSVQFIIWNCFDVYNNTIIVYFLEKKSKRVSTRTRTKIEKKVRHV